MKDENHKEAKSKSHEIFENHMLNKLNVMDHHSEMQKHDAKVWMEN